MDGNGIERLDYDMGRREKEHHGEPYAGRDARLRVRNLRRKRGARNLLMSPVWFRLNTPAAIRHLDSSGDAGFLNHGLYYSIIPIIKYAAHRLC
jgi:hypothetical protein